MQIKIPLRDSICALVFSSDKKRNSYLLELNVELFWGLNKLIHVKYSEQYLAIHKSHDGTVFIKQSSLGEQKTFMIT